MQLAKLSIACCRLKEVPADIGNMSTLRFLDLSFNELTTLPASMARLHQLNALNVSFNPLASFPQVVTAMHALLELNLDYTGMNMYMSHTRCYVLKSQDSMYLRRTCQMLDHNT